MHIPIRYLRMIPAMSLSDSLGAVVLAVLLCAAQSSAQSRVESDDEPLVRTKILSDVAAIEPGAEFRLAVHFEMREGWGIYWRNAGSTGLATQLELRLADGLSAGEIRWPGPQRKEGPAGLLDYIYTGETMLLVPITVAETVQPGTSVTIGVNAGWLACKDICVLGECDMTLTLPVAESSQPSDNRSLIGRFERKVPLDPKDFGRDYKIDWKGDDLIIEVTGARKLEFFPDASRAWRLSDPIRTGASSTSRLRLPIVFRVDDPDIQVTGVLATGFAGDEVIYVQIAAPRASSDANEP